MKTVTKVLSVVAAVAGVVVQVAPVLQAYIAAHPGAFSLTGAIALILALVHNPKAPQ